MSQYDVIPSHMMQAMHHYVATGEVSSDFLRAVIDNNLKEAVMYADSSNVRILHIYVMWFYNRAPMNCWGSPDKRNTWPGLPEWLKGVTS
jgi:hypothetical protein